MSAEFDERSALTALAALVDRLDQPCFSFASSGGAPEREGGFSVEAQDWVLALYRVGWIRNDVDWPQWGRTEAALSLRSDPKALAVATTDDLAKLLTLLVRSDRFCDGVLHQAHSSRLLHRISARAVTILSEIAAK